MRCAIHAGSRWQSLVAGIVAAAALAVAPPAAAFTTVGPGAFSSGTTKITFEDLPGDNSNIPAGYGSAQGIASFSANTQSEKYSDYGSTLATNAIAAGLGSIAATWGGGGSYGTGFSLSGPRQRVGMYLSSNVDITVQVSAYRGATLLGSQTQTFAPDAIAFFGFEDPAGIDRIVIGDNTQCVGCIHQLDNILLDGGAAAVPTLSEWGIVGLSGLFVLVVVVSQRRRSATRLQ